MRSFAFDWESYLITATKPFPKTVCLSYAFYDCVTGAFESYGVVLPNKADELIRYAISTGCRMVGAETAFDVFMHVANSSDPLATFKLWAAVADADLLHDVSLHQKLMCGAVDREHRLFKHGLGPLVKHWTGVELVKDGGWRLRYAELDGVPPEHYPPEAYDYALSDALGTARVDIEQQRACYSWYVSPVNGVRYREIFPAHDILADAPNQMRKALAIKDLAAAGLFTCERSVRAYEATLIEERDALLVDLVRTGLVRKEIKLNAEAVAAKFAERDIEVPRLASGRPSITGKLYAQLHRADDYLRYTQRGKAPHQWPQTAEYLAAAAPDLVDVSYHKNLNNIKATVAWAFEQPEAAGETPNYNVADDGVTKTTIKIDADNCERSGNPTLQLYARYSSIENTLGGAIELAKKAMHEPWHAHYNTLRDNGRTATGSDGGTEDGGNVQNMKRTCGQREMYIAPPGYLIAAADLAAAELSGFGQVSIWYVGWSECARMIKEGIDQHSVIGAALLNIPDPLNTGWKELKRRKDEKDQKADEARTAGKGVNFGCKARMSAKRYKDYAWNNYGLKVTVAEAKHHIELHNSIIAEMDPYTAAVTRFARYPNKRDTVYDLVHPKVGRLRAGLKYTDVHNYPFSGIIQDLAGEALWRLCKAKWGCSELGLSDPFFGCFPFLFTHDEISAYVPDDPVRATAAAKRLGRIMTQTARDYLPDVGCAADPNVLRHLSKKAGDAQITCTACGRVTARGKKCKHKDCEKPQTGDEVIIPFDAWAACAADMPQADKLIREGKADNLAAALAKRGWAAYIVRDVLAGHREMPR